MRVQPHGRFVRRKKRPQVPGRAGAGREAPGGPKRRENTEALTFTPAMCQVCEPDDEVCGGRFAAKATVELGGGDNTQMGNQPMAAGGTRGVDQFKGQAILLRPPIVDGRRRQPGERLGLNHVALLSLNVKQRHGLDPSVQELKRGRYSLLRSKVLAEAEKTTSAGKSHRLLCVTGGID